LEFQGRILQEHLPGAFFLMGVSQLPDFLKAPLPFDFVFTHFEKDANELLSQVFGVSQSIGRAGTLLVDSDSRLSGRKRLM
jgi:hypothetical protein